VCARLRAVPLRKREKKREFRRLRIVWKKGTDILNQALPGSKKQTLNLLAKWQNSDPPETPITVRLKKT